MRFRAPIWSGRVWADLGAGVESIESLLVLVGTPRLRRIGFDVPDRLYFPEDRLYEKLAEIHGDGAHSKYNALIRTLVSFERAAESLVGHGTDFFAAR